MNCDYIGCNNKVKVTIQQNWGKNGTLCTCNEHAPNWVKNGKTESSIVNFLGIEKSFYSLIKKED